jgi:RNA polymerase sigma factor (sigma-70 family)
VGPSREEFADFYRASWGPCLRAIVATGESPERAEELVAEAFARAWSSWPKLRSHVAPRAWVVRVALNMRISKWRRSWREVSLSDEELTPPEELSEPMDGDLLAAIKRLPLRQRQIIALRLLVDFDTEATAQHLGIAPGTVRSQMARGIQTLRQEFRLTQDDQEELPCPTAKI